MDRLAYGAHNTVLALRNALRSYLEAQYHIRHDQLIAERRRLFETPGEIFQLPYVEATPTYASGKPYSALRTPAFSRSVLETLASKGTLFETPFAHQAEALESFWEGDELIVATGTGSGKTESFLLPLLTSILEERATRQTSASLPGFRALLLYPMNALVNDQVGRLRRLLSDTNLHAALESLGSRRITFGSYTGRTPYPGVRSTAKDGSILAPLFEEFYLEIERQPELRDELRRKGRWPEKNLRAFFGKEVEEEGVYQSGKKYIKHHWDRRLKTQPEDVEMLTRHEMQEKCPDILVTNYSMLEYMLLRPIERPIFQQTTEWLHSDNQNCLIVVLDEAHMYRGTAGAEVALLLRRFHSRLNIDRSRVRYILTSASLGKTQEAHQAVVEFANKLTGLTPSFGRTFRLITGTPELRSVSRRANDDVADALAAFDLAAFNSYHVDPASAHSAVGRLAEALRWPAPPDDSSELANYLFDQLTGYDVAEELLASVSGSAVELSVLERKLFPKAPEETAKAATAAVLSLTTFARRRVDGRVFLPSRLHLFFRGVPGIFACIDQRCDKSDITGPRILGRLYTKPDLNCECSSKARIYELLTHRDCGAAFLRGFLAQADGDFLWHEAGEIPDLDNQGLIETHVLVEPTIHTDALNEVVPIWIEVATGRIKRTTPSDLTAYLTAYLPGNGPQVIDGKPRITFDRCPICTKTWRADQPKIMNLATKGEQPFANLVKAQVVNQPPQTHEDAQHPNGGRKSLLFSDGRQKAARLARDIPREVELDSFRQALSLAATRLEQLKGKARPTRELYVSFVSVVADTFLHLFDGASQRQLRSHVLEFQNDYSTIACALDESWDVKPPVSYSSAPFRRPIPCGICS